MRGHLIQIDARDGSGAVTRYLASADHPSLCHLNGQQWTPAIARLPSLAYDFFGGDFRSAIVTPSASFAAAADGMAAFTTLRFAGARVRIYTGTIGDAWGSFTLRFDGRIGAEPTVSAGIASFDAGPDDAWLDKPLLGLFLGTGGIEGPTDLTGTVKPLALGACRFAPGVLVDFTSNVYRVSGHGAVQGITAAYDRVVSLGASVADYADLAALLAASIANGRWGTCKALGLARLGAPADGQVSFDVSGDNAGAGGYARLPGAMIRRIAELAGGTVNTTNLAALDTARAWNLTRVWTAQTTAREAIQGIADSVCAVAGVTLTGTLFVAPLGYGTSSQTLKSDGTALPPVASVEVRPVAAPFWRLATEAEPTWVVHAPDSVASEYVIRGLYSATRTYRLDDLVESADGSAWVYVSATASAGNAPPTWPTASNTWWTNVAPPTNASWSLVANDNGAKASDYAGTTLNLNTVTSGAGALTRTGNSAVKTAGAGAYNAALVSADQFIGAVEASWCFASAAFQDALSGLSTTGATAIAATDLTYAWAGIPGSAPTVYESNVLKYTAAFTLSATDVLKIVANGLTVRYYANGGLEYTSAATPSHSQSYRFKTTMAGVGAKVTDIIVTPTNNAAFDAVGGSTKPENSADITSTVKGPGLATINCDSVGTVLAGELDKTYGFLLIRADGTDATTSAAWTRTVEAGTITSTIGAGTGVFSISAFGSDGARIKISAVLSGKTYNGIFEPSKVRAAAASGGSGGGTSGQVNISAAVTSTTPAAITVADLYVKAGSVGTIALTVSGSFGHAPNTTSSLGLKLKIQKWNGAAFADLSTEQSETAASFYYSGDVSWEDGSFGFTYSDTGLTTGTEYRYRVVGYTPSGTVTRNVSGSFSGVGS